MVKVKLTNGYDEENVRRGLMTPEEVRTTEVELLVDTGATNLSLPADVVEKLGLVPSGTRGVRYADGRVGYVPYVGGVKLEVFGRAGEFLALVHEAGTTPLMGQIVLEDLDLLVDAKSQEVYVNPRSPDTPMNDVLGDMSIVWR